MDVGTVLVDEKRSNFTFSWQEKCVFFFIKCIVQCSDEIKTQDIFFLKSK